MAVRLPLAVFVKLPPAFAVMLLVASTAPWTSVLPLEYITTSVAAWTVPFVVVVSAPPFAFRSALPPFAATAALTVRLLAEVRNTLLLAVTRPSSVMESFSVVNSASVPAVTEPVLSTVRVPFVAMTSALPAVAFAAAPSVTASLAVTVRSCAAVIWAVAAEVKLEALCATIWPLSASTVPSSVMSPFEVSVASVPARTVPFVVLVSVPFLAVTVTLLAIDFTAASSFTFWSAVISTTPLVAVMAPFERFSKLPAQTVAFTSLPAPTASASVMSPFDSNVMSLAAPTVPFVVVVSVPPSAFSVASPVRAFTAAFTVRLLAETSVALLLAVTAPFSIMESFFVVSSASVPAFTDPPPATVSVPFVAVTSALPADAFAAAPISTASAAVIVRFVAAVIFAVFVKPAALCATTSPLLLATVPASVMSPPEVSVTPVAPDTFPYAVLASVPSRAVIVTPDFPDFTTCSSTTLVAAVISTAPFVAVMDAVFLKFPSVSAVTDCPEPTLPASVMSPEEYRLTALRAPIVPSAVLSRIPPYAFTSTPPFDDVRACSIATLFVDSIRTFPFVAVTDAVFLKLPAAFAVTLLPAATWPFSVMSPVEDKSAFLRAPMVASVDVVSVPFVTVSFALPLPAVTAAFSSMSPLPAVSSTSVPAVTAPSAVLLSQPSVAVILT